MNRVRLIILGLVIAMTATLIPASANAATVATPTAKPTISYTTTCSGTLGTAGCNGPGLAATPTGKSVGVTADSAIGGIIGNKYSPQGSGGETITLTRKECYIIVCTTDYQAHLTVNWSWNVLAYGGVVYNITKVMYVDHLKATFQHDAPGYYQYLFSYTSAYGNTSPNGGSSVNGTIEVKQCIPACVQTETVEAYIHVHDDGSWIADINHS